MRAALRAIGSAAALIVIYYVLPLDHRPPAVTATSLFLASLVLVGIVVWQTRAILRSQYPALRAVEALAVIVPLFLLAFAATYFVLAQSSAGSFSQPLSRTDSIYFAVTVFSTVGFGDITARSEAGRIVVTIQMVADILAIGLGLRVILNAVQTRGREIAEATGAPSAQG